MAGLLAAGLSLSVGLLLGGIAGFYGSWRDEVLMRVVSGPAMAVPALCRARILPLNLAPAQAFLLLIIVIGLIAWARLARLIRGGDL